MLLRNDHEAIAIAMAVLQPLPPVLVNTYKWHSAAVENVFMQHGPVAASVAAAVFGSLRCGFAIHHAPV